MNPLTKLNLLLSFLYLLIGSSLGLMLGFEPARNFLYSLKGIPSYAHAHIQLVGFVTQMIVGVTYHIIPMLTRGKVYSFRLGYLHTALLNVGLALQIYGFLSGNPYFKALGSLILFLAILMYIFNILKSGVWR
ncbi:cytochrome c oxidase cbb3-type subunit 1 [Hydrogenivirga caldilitoris]|uniref:Cytochrome c oxidase cbb3-type subunit 1 n=1 Tax=Hydrogenivirga caldilitoris TaxID=246264 RepID=A0A497XVS4_9AQUI|nr:hypothetical protein [Hydrogenivirga caldilitoris]RLJ70883.1 cytochrome c oxidase cbb3-type subunit 1 [Hydrogenivirga caldilitoris]